MDRSAVFIGKTGFVLGNLTNETGTHTVSREQLSNVAVKLRLRWQGEHDQRFWNGTDSFVRKKRPQPKHKINLASEIISSFMLS